MVAATVDCTRWYALSRSRSSIARALMRGFRRPRRAGRRKAGQPHPIDVHVGRRVRLRRTMLLMSQEKLAAALGLTFQQVQKYERAANRISASRLYHLCRILKIPISFFFSGLEAEGR